MAQAALVTVDGVALDRTVGTTDVHLRAIPVIVPVRRRTMVTRRGKAARRRPNSRVRTNRASIPFLAD